MHLYSKTPYTQSSFWHYRRNIFVLHALITEYSEVTGGILQKTGSKNHARSLYVVDMVRCCPLMQEYYSIFKSGFTWAQINEEGFEGSFDSVDKVNEKGRTRCSPGMEDIWDHRQGVRNTLSAFCLSFLCYSLFALRMHSMGRSPRGRSLWSTFGLSEYQFDILIHPCVFRGEEHVHIANKIVKDFLTFMHDGKEADYRKYIFADPRSLSFYLRAHVTDAEQEEYKPPIYHLCLCPDYAHAKPETTSVVMKSWTPFDQLDALVFPSQSESGGLFG